MFDPKVFDSKMFDELTTKLNAAFASSPAQEVDRNVRALLAQGFSKLDLVTREEFDVQVELLERARQRLDALEARVAELESRQR